MDRINNRFEHCKALRRQADTSANYNAGIISRGQVILHRLPGRSIRTDVANIALPSRSVISLSASETPARIFSALIPGARVGLE